ncbi:MAG: hypothetical protein AAFX78_04160, partial [Cyanobacteria bacterium J06638_20]
MVVARGFNLPINGSAAGFGPLAFAAGNVPVREDTTTTHITVGGFEIIYTGMDLTYDSDGMFASGDITGFLVNTPGGSPYYELTNADADAAQLAPLLRNDDFQGYVSYLFRGDDISTGSTQEDYLNAGLGNDQVFGGEGNDSVLGEEDNDRLSGEEGDDRILGGEGNDRMLGGDGQDNMVGGSGNDRGLGGEGNDRIAGNAGTERLIG